MLCGPRPPADGGPRLRRTRQLDPAEPEEERDVVLTYRRTNHGNLHVRGFKEEGTTTTPFDMTVLNDLDRFHLVMDVINRVPRLGSKSARVKEAMRDKRSGVALCTVVAPALVTASVLDELRALKELAPLHIPADIAVLEQVQQSVSGTPVIAVFDTAFHQTLPEVASTYALPVELCARHGLRRYGFHGISHAYVSRELIKHLGRGAKGARVITCHRGNGASVCAVRDGQSIDTSMGFTPMEGLVMGTRSGDVDPGLLVYLIRTDGMTVGQVDRNRARSKADKRRGQRRASMDDSDR